MSGEIHIREFTSGLDTRRLPETTGPGFLIRGQDVHINRGGEAEQRPAFVLSYALEPGRTVGLAADNDGLIVFGSGAAPTLPAGIAYQELALGVLTLERVMSWDLAAGLVYAAVRYDDGTKAHFYDEVQVVDFDPSGAGADYAPGDFVLTYDTKMYALSGSAVHFSAIEDFDEFDAGTGFGFVDMAGVAGEAKQLTALAPYQNNLAVFAPRIILIYYFDVDPTLSTKVQVLNNIGTGSPLSVTQFGDADVFFLDTSGVRSLRARDSSNAASTSDVGVLIDKAVLDKVRTLTDEEKSRIIGLIEPTDNRFWLIIKDQIFVFSYFEGSKVRAWTVYNPGFAVDDAVVFQGRVYLRSGDSIYTYGGLGDVPVYDATEAEIWLPYLDAEKPTTEKDWTNVHVACVGEWEVRVAARPTNLDISDKVATVTATTFGDDPIPVNMRSTHLSLRFKAAAPGYKAISAAVLNYS